MNRPKQLYFVLGALLIVWVYVALLSPSADAPQGPAQDIAIRTEGGEARLSELKGKVVLLDFWATWCQPCRTSIPSIQRLYNRYRSRGFEVLGVSLDSSDGPIRGFVNQLGMEYPSGRPVSPEQVTPYRAESIPTMVLVDRQGRIRRHQVGYSRDMEEELAKSIERLLNE